jgi:Ca-activated chloride channel family protein
MIGLSDLVLLRPAWLLAVPLIAVVAVLIWRSRRSLGDWNQAIDPVLLSALRSLGRVETAGKGVAGIAALLVAAIAVLALTGPAVERRDAVSFRNLDGVVFVLDASPSATGGDAWVGLQTAGRIGIGSLGSRPGGLVIYGGDAYVATAMTADTQQLGQTLSLVDAETVPDPGSRPERGLNLAAAMLEEAGVLAGDVILLTDGGGLGPNVFDAAGSITAQGARLSIVSPDPEDADVIALAAAGSGQVFGTDQGLLLAEFMQDDARTRLEQQDYPLLFKAELGRYFLILALIPAAILFRRRSV